VIVALLLLSLLQSQPPEEVVRQAIELQKSGDYAGAVTKYREFLKIQPDAVPIRSNLGVSLASLGRFDEAIAEYGVALKQDPANTGIALNLAIAYYKTGRIPEAANELKALHARAPDQMRITMLLADCDLRMGKNEDVIHLLTFSPDSKENNDLAVAYMLGMALIRAGRVPEGQREVDRILRNGDSAEAHLMLGSAKLSISDLAGAREEFSKAVALNPNLPELHSLYGVSLLSTGDAEAAQREFRIELKSDPNSFEANLELGVLARQDQKLDDAMGFFDRALRVRPGDIAVRYQISTVLLAQSKVDESLKELLSIVQEAPQFTEAHVTLATVYYRLKRKEDGERERALVHKLTAEAQAKQPAAKDPGK
jgi:tetratricopeptide (TPR) repeat protein